MIAASDFLPDIWPHIRRAPDFMVERNIVHTAQEFLRETGLWRESLMVMAAPVSRDVELPVFDHWRVYTILSVARVPGGPLDAVTVERIGMGEKGAPTAYAVLADGRIRLNRIPNALVRLEVEASLVPTGDRLPAFLVDHRDDIKAGTLARLFAQEGEAWADPVRSAEYESRFRGGIASARIKAARGNSSAELRVRIPRF